MTPAGRAGAAVGILDRIIAGEPAEAALLRWARGSRYAGSGDRAAVRDLVFDSLRRRCSRAALGGSDSGRGLILGGLRETGSDPATIFGAGPYAPAALSATEAASGRDPTAEEALNLPLWLLPELAADLGPDLAPVAARLAERAPVWLRVNLLKATPQQAEAALAQDGIAIAPAADLATALRVTDGARKLRASHAYMAGLVELQDIAPQRALALLGDLHGAQVLDFCAGGGGKALALAAAGAGPILAHDIDPRRMTDLPLRAERAGARVALAAGTGPRGTFDLVLADVPCSGSGTWARNPDARWRLNPSALSRLVEVQARILDSAAEFVRPGQRLALMTCSMLHRENEAQAGAFLTRWPGFRMEAERRITPLEGGDGFYSAIFRQDG